MKTTHTPGPWYLQQSGRILHIKGADGFYPATVAHDCGEPQVQANARLIAAAPDLLEGVEQACAALDMCLNSGDTEGALFNADQTLIVLRALLYRAKGES